MRVSANENDSGYEEFAKLGGPTAGIRVFLDDVEQRYAETADDELGMITKAKLNSEGQLYVVNHEVVRETLYGKVRIECARHTTA